ncbi:MAG: response regulator [Candidatus Nitrohelix vancouverensis]|uniref:Response regulator n=1 Tax=Candidatus Nitrohelix vancouverensis TaxID=2705534 RepID=A0A7T0G499_9BACT|nr:MAG: response regulator [Candidatus Nitrohelix vancouverensis]
MKSKEASYLILVIEDSDFDFKSIMKSFNKCGFKNIVHRITNGDNALDYLFNRGEFVDPIASPSPDLIFLDLNLPGSDGHEILEELKNDPKMRMIPVVIMTSSGNAQDIQNCYARGANSYVIKPTSSEGFLKAIQGLNDYWFKLSILPTTMRTP